MARFNTNEIVSVITEEIREYRPQLEAREVGRVLEVGDGIARVYGLSGVMAGELVEFTRTGVRGLAFNLEENSVGVIILGQYLEITEGDEVRSTGELLRVPVGPAMIGRVVDPLGNPRDAKGPIVTDTYRPVESYAPGVAGRQPVNQPLQTGIKAIDSMTPIGRGQRELIIGDRKTGKTAIAVDAIINQRGENVVCVYVAIGQKESAVAKVVEGLRAAGAMDYTIVVSAASSDPAPLQYIAPYAGCAMAEYFMYEKGATRSASTTTCRSRRPPIASCRCSCAARPAARPIPAISSMPILAFSNALPSWPSVSWSSPATPMKPRSPRTGASFATPITRRWSSTARWMMSIRFV